MNYKRMQDRALELTSDIEETMVCIYAMQDILEKHGMQSRVDILEDAYQALSDSLEYLYQFAEE